MTLRAWYNKRERQWALELTQQPVTYWRHDDGTVRYFLTAQHAYDAYRRALITRLIEVQS